MASLKDDAVALRRLDYSETSQVLAVFTRAHGQQRLIAKGIKRSTKTRVAVGIDLLEAGTVVFIRKPGHEDTLGTLTEWQQTDTFPHLRTDLGRLYAAQYAAEVTTSLTEVHDPHPDLFEAIVAFFASLKTTATLPALSQFLWTLLDEIGLRPDLSRCMSCGRSVEGDREVYFSSRESGAICRDCEPAVVDKRRIDPRAAEQLRAWAEESVAVDDAGTTEDMGATGSLPAGANGEGASSGASTRAGGMPWPAIFDLLDHHLTQILHHPPRLASAIRTAIPELRGR